MSSTTSKVESKRIAREAYQFCVCTSATRPHLTKTQQCDILKKYSWGPFSPCIARMCANCLKTGATKVCIGCCGVSYFDSSCQRSNWTDHKKSCTAGPMITIIPHYDMRQVRADINRKGWGILYHRTGNIPVTLDPLTDEVYELVMNQKVVTQLKLANNIVMTASVQRT
ncbi:hypothetical protein JKP88DRAFT_248321 [Tribonema minus]|uniref:MYND-type domain-containing protein n=1 Tax=Tribonema minus TaxID=303371 RepID=A0A836CAT3_9STRA|nr:hypothetical protein JKP88DRAFT_248321 [Tribonema minus]